MSCDFPLAAYHRSDVNPSGKRSFQFVSKGSLNGQVHLLPCGKCTGCRLERARVWGIRCMHEARMHVDNCFLTLTYDKDNLPATGSLDLREYQLFLKKLRKYVYAKTGQKLRFYGCGEYGDINKRPHYHFLIFGFDFKDKLFYSKSGEDDIFTSKTLDAIWGKGGCKLGAVTFKSANYVAKYCMKKVDGAKRDAGHYIVYDMNGELHDRTPEFATMSRRPGIASGYYDKFGAEIRDHDTLIVNGKEVPSIRYYDKKFEAIDADALARVKRLRHPVAKFGRETFLREGTKERKAVKAHLKELNAKQKARKL